MIGSDRRHVADDLGERCRGTGRVSGIADIEGGDGMGAGVVDRLRENKIEIVEYRAGVTPTTTKGQEKYINKKTEDCFFLKEEMIQGGRLKIMPELLGEAQTVRYKFASNGKKQIVSKEEMRRKNVKSPNKFDALMMACSEVDNALRTKKTKYSMGYAMPSRSKQENMFSR